MPTSTRPPRIQVADALIRAGKDFDLLVVPGGGHAVGRSEEPIDYVHRRVISIFRAPPDGCADAGVESCDDPTGAE